MEMYLVCPKCKDRYVPKETYEWVSPENSDIYKAIHNSMKESDIDDRHLYSEIRDLELNPLVSVTTKSPTRAEHGIQNKPVCSTNEQWTKETSVDEEEHSKPNSSSSLNIDEEYVSMSGSKIEYGNEGRHLISPSSATKPTSETQPVARNLGARDSPLFNRSRERPLSIDTTSTASHDGVFSDNKGFLRHLTPAKTSLDQLNSASDRYTSEPIASRSTTSRKVSKDHGHAFTDVISSSPSQTTRSDNRGAHGLGDGQTLLPAEVSKLLEKKYGIEDAVFITDV